VYYICITLSKKFKRIQNCVTSKSNFNPKKGGVTSNLAPFSTLPPLGFNPKMTLMIECILDQLLKLSKTLSNYIFLYFINVEKLFSKFSFSFRNFVLKMVGYYFCIKDLRRRCPLES